jgi:hypothetical protein
MQPPHTALPPESIVTLLDALVRSDETPGGTPALPTGARAPLVRWLRRVLVDADARAAHHRQLRARLAATARHDQVLPDSTIEIILAGGLDRLDDDTLARLALNPVALDDLCDEIEHQLPTAWLDDLGQDGQDLVRQLGLTVPMLTGKTPLPPQFRRTQPLPFLDPPAAPAGPAEDSADRPAKKRRPRGKKGEGSG